jgi:transposase
VDTHKDLHVAAVVDEQDRVLGTRCFATTRQGYRQMLAWMQSFGDVQRIGIESTGSYGAGLPQPATVRGSHVRPMVKSAT